MENVNFKKWLEFFIDLLIIGIVIVGVFTVLLICYFSILQYFSLT